MLSDSATVYDPSTGLWLTSCCCRQKPGPTLSGESPNPGCPPSAHSRQELSEPDLMRLPKSRSFRLLLGGTVVSQLGDWAARLALSFLVFYKTDSDTMVGVTAALLTIPWLGLGQWLAHKGDRFDRRRLLVACDASRGLLFIIIGFTTLPLGVLLTLVFVVATIDPVFEANRSALIADVVSKRDYANAIQATHGVNQVAQLAGFGLGGLLVSIYGPSTALVLNGLSFFGSALLMGLIRMDSRGSERKGAAPSFGQAVRFLRADHISLVAIIATVVTVALANAVETQITVYGEVVAGMTERGIGLLAATVPLATLFVIWALDSGGGDLRLLTRGIAMALFSAVPAAGLLWIGQDTLSIVLGYACLGGVFVLSTTGNIVAGRRIPPEIRVGTFAVLQASVYVGVGVGAFLGGLVSERTSPRDAAGIAMSLCAVACVFALLAVARIARSRNANEAKKTAAIAG